LKRERAHKHPHWDLLSFFNIGNILTSRDNPRKGPKHHAPTGNKSLLMTLNTKSHLEYDDHQKGKDGLLSTLMGINNRYRL
jgi:hypothetical protein